MTKKKELINIKDYIKRVVSIIDKIETYGDCSNFRDELISIKSIAVKILQKSESGVPKDQR